MNRDLPRIATKPRRLTSSPAGLESRMAMRKRELVYRDGKPAAVILDIAEYEELLERAEDLDDLRALRRIRERPLRFRSLADVLTACPQDDTGSFVARDARPSSTRVRRPSRSGRRT